MAKVREWRVNGGVLVMVVGQSSYLYTTSAWDCNATPSHGPPTLAFAEQSKVPDKPHQMFKIPFIVQKCMTLNKQPIINISM